MQSALKVKLPVCILFCLAGFTASAQFDISRLELGADADMFIYQGDLTPKKIGSFKTMKPGLGIYGSYKLSNIFSLKTNFVFGSLRGDESRYSKPAYMRKRNFKFTTPVTEISESLVWNIVPPGTKDGPGLTPYISAGIGYAFLHTRRDYSNYNAVYFSETRISTGLHEDILHSLPKGIIVFPVSMGLRYSLTKNISLNLATTYRFSSTDYLDGFSQSGNPAKNDHFFTNAIGLIYSFGKSNMIKCPKMKY